MEPEIHTQANSVFGRFPSRLLKTSLIASIGGILLLLTGSYFISFPTIVRAPVIIHSNPGAIKLGFLSSGRIIELYHQEGEYVNQGDTIAYYCDINTKKDISKLIIYLDQLNDSTNQFYPSIDLTGASLLLGELQEYFSRLQNRYNEYNQWRNDVLFEEKKRYQYNIIKGSQTKRETLENSILDLEERMIIEKSLIAKYENLYDIGGISEIELVKAKLRLSEIRQAINQILTSKEIAQIDLLNEEKALKEMVHLHQLEGQSKKTQITIAISELKNQLSRWRENHLIIAPTCGMLTYSNKWIVNQHVEAGDIMGAVVPKTYSNIIATAEVNNENIGKIEIGQKVRISFDAFPQFDFGFLRGNVQTISLIPEDQRYFITISLPNGMATDHKKEIPFIQELEGNAKILTHDQRLIERLFQSK